MLTVKFKIGPEEIKKIVTELEEFCEIAFRRTSTTVGKQIVKYIRDKSREPKTGRFYARVRFGPGRNQVKLNHISGNRNNDEGSAELSGKLNRNTKSVVNGIIMSVFVQDNVPYAFEIEKDYHNVERGINNNMEILVSTFCDEFQKVMKNI